MSEGINSPALAVSNMTVPRKQRNLFKGTGCARGFGFLAVGHNVWMSAGAAFPSMFIKPI